VPGSRIYLSKSSGNKRKTEYDLRFVVDPLSGQLVSVDSRLPNSLFVEAMRRNVRSEQPLSLAKEYRIAGREITVPSEGEESVRTRSRIDFLLEGDGCPPMWVEVKSVTLVEDRIALFPDAPTVRGRRHVRELANLIQRQRARAAIVFMVQRADADLFRPNLSIDPDFADSLTYAFEQGVEVLAYTCLLTPKEIRIDRPIPVVIPALC
jgi:sugar fermentation stimulation protein A